MEDGSVGKVLAVKTQGPEFRSSAHPQKSSRVACFVPLVKEAETDGSQKLVDQLVY